MYQTSQCYSPSQGGGNGGLEYLASSGGGSYSSSAGYSSTGNVSYARQDSIPSPYRGMASPYGGMAGIPSPETPSLTYENNVQYKQDEIVESVTKLKQEYHFIPDNFLKPGKEGKFIGQAEEVKEFVGETFANIFNEKFPDDIKVSVLNAERFRKLAPNPATTGLSINRRKQGLLSEVFVLNDSIGRVLLTIGHELGHVLTSTLDSQHDEEAKAYAFSLQWMKVIRENDIAGLGDAIVTERPANNGLHNVAFFFVEKLVRKGKKAWEVYLNLVRKIISVPAGC